MVTREEIRLAYLFLLGREPEGESCYVDHAWHPDVSALRNTIAKSDEGVRRMRIECREVQAGTPFNYFQSQIIFIHLEKVGGTSLYQAIHGQFSAPRVSPPHLNCIPSCTMAELNNYDFVSGHFSYEEAMALPRAQKKFIIMFREPFSRLISFYRFHRAHPEDLLHDRMVYLAKQLPIVDFFRHAEVRTSPRVNNAYLKCLTGYSGEQAGPNVISTNDALSGAYQRLAEIDVVALTEHMPASVYLINHATGLSVSPVLTRENVTADLHKHRINFNVASDISVSSELIETLSDLVEYDLKIYARAEEIFHQAAAQVNNAGITIHHPLSALQGATARSQILERFPLILAHIRRC